MTIEEIIEKVTTALVEEFEIELSEITPEASLKDTLDLDSLDIVDLVVVIEQIFGMKLTNQDFIGIVTFQDFCNLLNKKING
jgi:acyl carrier protein